MYCLVIIVLVDLTQFDRHCAVMSHWRTRLNLTKNISWSTSCMFLLNGFIKLK